MSEAHTKLIEATLAMNPIAKSWLIHGEIVSQMLSLINVDELSEAQREDLADGCHEWGEMMSEVVLLWWDAEEQLRGRREAAA